MNMVSGSAVFYSRGEQCLTASSELSIGLDDIQESILFLHEDLLSADVTDGDEQKLHWLCKNIRGLERNGILEVR